MTGESRSKGKYKLVVLSVTNEYGVSEGAAVHIRDHIIRWRSALCSARFTPGERGNCARRIVDLVEPRVGLDVLEK